MRKFYFIIGVSLSVALLHSSDLQSIILEKRAGEMAKLKGLESTQSENKAEKSVAISVVDIVKVVCLGDTHGRLPEDLPHGDVLIHSGDFSRFGKKEIAPHIPSRQPV